MFLFKHSVKGAIVTAAISFLFLGCEGKNEVSVTYSAAPPSPEDEQDSTGTAENWDIVTEEILFDDFEDGNKQNSLEETWYWYNDNGAKAKSVIATPKGNGKDDLVPTETDNGSKMALVIQYTLEKADYAYEPYVGWGAGIGNIDPSKLTGIKYKYKGNQHFVQIETSTVEDSDQFRYSVPKSDSWKEITISFDKLAQEGWGKPVEFNPAKITKIAFQEKGGDGSGEVHLDDIYLISETKVPAKSDDKK